VVQFLKARFKILLIFVLAVLLLLPVVPVSARSYRVVVHIQTQLYDYCLCKTPQPGDGGIFGASVQDSRVDTVQDALASWGVATSYDWSVKPQCCVGQPGPGQNATFFLTGTLETDGVSFPASSKFTSLTMLGPYLANSTVVFKTVPTGSYNMLLKLYVLNGSSSVIMLSGWNEDVLLP
jgi:hypothetical protein